jgi:hypothetical protein
VCFDLAICSLLFAALIEKKGRESKDVVNKESTNNEHHFDSQLII